MLSAFKASASFASKSKADWVPTVPVPKLTLRVSIAWTPSSVRPTLVVAAVAVRSIEATSAVLLGRLEVELGTINDVVASLVFKSDIDGINGVQASNSNSVTSEVIEVMPETRETSWLATSERVSKPV